MAGAARKDPRSRYPDLRRPDLDGADRQRRQTRARTHGRISGGNGRLQSHAELRQSRGGGDCRQRRRRARVCRATVPGAQRRRLDDPGRRLMLLGRRGDGVDRLQGPEENPGDRHEDRQNGCGQRGASGGAPPVGRLPWLIGRRARWRASRPRGRGISQGTVRPGPPRGSGPRRARRSAGGAKAGVGRSVRKEPGEARDAHVCDHEGVNMLGAVLFDIDGTLIDSNDLHVKAWKRAFAEHGHHLASSAILQQICKGGDNLIPALLPQAGDDEREAIADRHSMIFREQYLRKAKPFEGARELLTRVHADGRRVVLASSAKQEELDHYVALMEVGDIVYVTTSSDDADQSKPAPDIFAIALDKA